MCLCVTYSYDLWMMFRGKIAAVSYLNTIPFIYGIEYAKKLHTTLLLRTPSNCAELFKRNEVDIALVPVGSLYDLEDYKIITSFCIGASTNVRTVTIMGNSPIDKIDTLWLDSHSRSSALLAKILCEEYWKITPNYRYLDDYSVLDEPKANEAFLLIGDKVFDYESKFKYIYDLAEEWQLRTKLPFVFAVWIAKVGVEDDVIENLEMSLAYGVENVKEALTYFGYNNNGYEYGYLTRNIDFIFDDEKHVALDLFWEKGLKYKRFINPG